MKGVEGDEVFGLGKGVEGVYGNLFKMVVLFGRGREGRLERMWKEVMGVVEDWLFFWFMFVEEDRDEMGDRRDVLLVGEVRMNGDEVEMVLKV